MSENRNEARMNPETDLVPCSNAIKACRQVFLWSYILTCGNDKEET